LLHKNPARCQSFPLSFGQAHVFYPEVAEDRCTAALLLDVDPVAMVRGRGGVSQTALAQYVNDRPYVASSLMSVAIAQVFGPALDGRSKERPELAKTPIPLCATLEVLPCRGGENLLYEVFQPLGYEIETVRHPLDEVVHGVQGRPLQAVRSRLPGSALIWTSSSLRMASVGSDMTIS
jgi:hypothetical protein